MIDRDYNYLYGVIRSRESELVTATQLDDLVNMRSINDINQILSESSFAQNFLSNLTEEGLEKALQIEYDELRYLIDTYAPESALRKFYLLPRDLYNFKVAIRSNLVQVDYNQLTGPEGVVDVKNIKESITQGNEVVSAGDIGDVTQDLKRVLDCAISVFHASGRSGQVLELCIDRLSNLYQARIAQDMSDKAGSVFSDFASLSAAEMIVRGRNAGVPWHVVSAALLDFSGIADIEEIYSLRIEEWNTKLNSFQGIFRDFMTRVAEGEDVSGALRAEQKKLDQLVAEWRWASPSFTFVCYYIRKKV